MTISLYHTLTLVRSNCLAIYWKNLWTGDTLVVFDSLQAAPLLWYNYPFNFTNQSHSQSNIQKHWDCKLPLSIGKVFLSFVNVTRAQFSMNCPPACSGKLESFLPCSGNWLSYNWVCSRLTWQQLCPHFFSFSLELHPSQTYQSSWLHFYGFSKYVGCSGGNPKK